MWRVVLALLIMSCPANAAAQPVEPDNSEMTALYEADQAARQNLTPEKVESQEFIRKMNEDDADRYKRTKELLNAGALSTANDYYHAAFIFQHGSTADSYLLAHTLAVAAAARGDERSLWIAAATLDRYLQEIGHAQIYGTQFSKRSGEEWTMEPYDRELIPDALREALGVSTQKEQTDRLADMRKGRD